MAHVEISAVIPCLNEARTIGTCIKKAQEAFRRMGVQGEVIVADNGSSDGSQDIGRSLDARVIFQARKGYGAALSAGIKEARGKIIVMGDGDDSYDWLSIEPLIRKVQEGYDLVMGNRFLGGIHPGAMRPLHRYVGNPLLSAVAKRAFSVQIGDFHCGMRAFTMDAWLRIRPRTDGMEFATEMVANAALQRLRITEVPIALYPDGRERRSHLRSFRDGWRHLRFILTYAPDHLYLIPGGVLLLVGLALQVVLATGPVVIGGRYFGIHYLALGSLFSLVGFNILVLGVLARAIVARRHRPSAGRLTRWFQTSYRLEYGLLAGMFLILAGSAVDAVILITWLAEPGRAMENTVHAAFAASTVVVLGVSTLFNSFLLHLTLAESYDDSSGDLDRIAIGHNSNGQDT